MADAQVTWLVRSWVELSEKVPVAVNCSVSPLGTLGLAGVTAIDCRAAALTVSTVEPVMPPSVALMVDVPVATPVASPAAVIGGHRGRRRRPGHLAGQVLRRVVGEGAGGGELLGLSLGDARVGRRHRDRLQDRGADRQHRRAGDRRRASALIVDVPVATPVARPAAVIVATEVVAEAQVTWLVRSWVELSENVPVAVNCSVSPLATLGLAGVTAIDCRTAAADRQHRRAGDAVERGGDRGGARRHAGGQARPR